MTFREVSAGYMTNLAARLFQRAVDDSLRELGISAGYLPVLFELGDGSEMTQTALARAVVIEQPTMAATLTRMERDGLIRRRPDPDDGRISLISLTPIAMRKVKPGEAAVAKVNARALGELRAKEREAYMAALAKIVSALRPDG
jgi:MarR family transcriptional regulator for hemolysin